MAASCSDFNCLTEKKVFLSLIRVRALLNVCTFAYARSTMCTSGMTIIDIRANTCICMRVRTSHVEVSNLSRCNYFDSVARQLYSYHALSVYSSVKSQQHFSGWNDKMCKRSTLLRRDGSTAAIANRNPGSSSEIFSRFWCTAAR